MKYQFIQAHLGRYPVRRLCHALRVSVSGYYASRARPVSARQQRQAALTEQIQQVHADSHATYGAPRVHAELIAQGQTCCKNTVARLMRKAGIVPKTVRRFRLTTDSRNTKASPNLLGRVFKARRANEIWLTDVTFILTREGWLSQEAFADKIGFHRTYISAIERGKRNVSLDNVDKIAKALRIDPVELLKDR